MPCKVTKLPEVKNKEGKMVPSKLFSDLIGVVGTIPQAMYYWSLVRKPEFLRAEGNWLIRDDTRFKLDENGEFSIDNFKIGPSSELAIIEREPSEVADGVWGTNLSDDEVEVTTEKVKKLTGFEKLINERKELIKILKRRLSQNTRIKGDEAIRNELIYSRISRINKAIQDMESRFSVNNYIKVLHRELDIIEKDLNKVTTKIHKNATPENLLVRLTELRELSHYIKGFQNSVEYLPSSDLETQAKIRFIQSKGDALHAEFIKGLQQAFLHYANKTSFSTQFTEEIYEPQVDIDTFSLETLGLAYNESTLLQITDDVIKYAEKKINQAYSLKRIEIEKAIKAAEKATGLSGAELYDLFLEKTEGGRWTGHLVTQASPEYMSERFSMEERAKKEGKLKAFFNWLDENEDRMTRDMYVDGKSNYFSEEEHLEQNKRILDFKNAERAYMDGELDKDLYTDSDSNFLDVQAEKDYNKELENWRLINSPYEYWKQRSGAIRFDYRREGDKYIVSPKPKKKNISKQYKNYFKPGNEGQLEFFNFIQRTFRENRRYIPLNRYLQENYLPEMERSLGAKLSGSSMLGKMGDLVDELKNSVTNELAEEYSSTISIAGKDILSVSQRGMSNKMQVDRKSQNLSEILLDNTEMALNYHFKTLIEPVANASVELLDQMEEKEVETIGDEELSVKKDGGEVKAVKNRLANNKAHLQSTINATLYGIHKNVEGRSGKKVILKERRKEYNAYKKQLADGDISQEEFDKKVNDISREITWSGVVDTLIKYTYIKALSFPNVVSPAVNVIFGLLSNITYAAAGEHFTDREIFKATSVMMGVMMGRKLHLSKHLEKIYAFMDEMNILADVNESNYGARKTWSEILVILQAKAEYLNQGSVMLAMLYNTKFKDKQGKSVTAYDSFKINEDGALEWDTEKMGEQEEVAPDKIIGEHGLNMFRFGNKITGINKYLHGDYFSHLKLKEKSLGRMLFLFKTWLPMSIKHRFGKESFDPNLQERIKGRYRVGNVTNTEGEKLTNKELLATIAKGIFTGKRALNELSDIDRANIARNIRELHLIAIMATVVFGLTMLIGDDDDRKNARIRILVNTLSKARQDMMLYMQPSSMTQVANNLIPLISTINDVTQLTRATIALFSDNAVYESGPWKDHLKLEPALYKIVPVINVYPRFKSMGHRIYQ